MALKIFFMKKKTLYFLLLIIFVGCEPSYRVYIRNSSTTNLYIKTHPSIESNYDSHSLYYDTILFHKSKQDSLYSTYEIKPNETFLLLGTIGGGPSTRDFPFDYIAFVTTADSTILDSREKIIEQIKIMGSKRNYFIEIKK